jgi:hypothetical protein
MSMRDDARLRRHRLILSWVMATALWVAALSVWVGTTRPAPTFAEVGSLLLGGPLLLAALFLAYDLRRRRR